MRNIRISVVGMLFAALLTPSLMSTAHAVDEKTNGANTLKVSPVRTDTTIAAGETKTIKTTVTNLTDKPITIRPIENDFVAGDKRGTPALILDEKKFAPTHSLKRFMKPIGDITIPAKDAKTVSVTISIPAGAKAGGYYGAIRFAPAQPDGGGQVNLNTSVASLILITVPGALSEELNLQSFDIRQNGKSNGYFGSPEKINAFVEFKNVGNVQVGPFGKVSVKKGEKLVYEADFNQNIPRDVILPDSSRQWDIPIKKLDKLGHYTVSATFTYGETNKSIQLNDSFWVIPRTLILGAIALLIALIVAIVLLVRNHRYRHQSLRHNRRLGRH